MNFRVHIVLMTAFSFSIGLTWASDFFLIVVWKTEVIVSIPRGLGRVK